MFIFTLIILLTFGIYGALIAWYRLAWSQIPTYKPKYSSGRTITVLIPARNEQDNIGRCLDSLAAQTYPHGRFQIIVIDDHSTDQTAAIVNSYRTRLPNLTCLDLETALGNDQNPTSHKKRSLEAAIARSQSDLIVTTDADCTFHRDWLSTIASFQIETGAKFIAAPVRIGETRPQTILNIFQILDFITLQGITGASVSRRFHSMCNGANLAYERAAFNEVNGFRDIDHIPSGDDMLLMHKIYRRYPEQVHFLKSREVIVSTQPETKWKGFVNQRIRWASKADSYDDKRIFWVLLLVYIVNVFLLILPFGAIVNWWYLWVWLILIVAKTAVEYPFVWLVARFFGQQRLMVYFPLLQPFHILYTVIIGWLGKFGSYRWKERKISK